MPTKRRQQHATSAAAAMIRSCATLGNRLILADWLEERRDLPKLAGLLRQPHVQPNSYAGQLWGSAQLGPPRAVFARLDGNTLIWLTVCVDAGVSFVLRGKKKQLYRNFQIDGKKHHEQLVVAFDELAKRGTEIADAKRGFATPETGDETRHNKNQVLKLCELLRLLGVKDVSIEYDGYGDSGQIENTTLTPERELPPGCLTFLDALADTFMPDGYENNEGGFGKLSIDIKSGKITREHNTRYTETTFEEDEF